MLPQLVSRGSFRLILVSLLVGAVLWVPAAVRASGNVRTQASSIIRLNRGFDVPVEKKLVTPTDAPQLPAVDTRHETLSAVPATTPLELHDVIPDSPDTVAPDLLRGPPVTTLR